MTSELRADSGFAIPDLYDWCDVERITYTIGLVTNARLARTVAPLQAKAERPLATQDGANGRLIDETMYQAASWPGARRVVMKAEVLPKDPSTQFVVTSRDDDPMSGMSIAGRRRTGSRI